MGFEEEIKNIKQSLKKQELHFNNELILNPVENIPPYEILLPGMSFLHGLYNTDKLRNNNNKIETKIQFSNRDSIAKDINHIYSLWANVLNAEKVSIRMFSGLHAHIVIFMAITNIGDTVLLLPEKAGGHMATKNILERLGIKVFEFVVDNSNMQIDIKKTNALIESIKPNIIFVDRSEGLVYEDFSWLAKYNIFKIFDASQYLTNIIAKDYKNPFEMGFDAMISTLHKNFPGPQRALYCSKYDDDNWRLFSSKIGTYVSNIHSYDIYSAGLILEKLDVINRLSELMLRNTMKLDDILANNGLNIVKRNISAFVPPTHHIWIAFADKKDAFDFYLKMEEIGINTNYRLLPYDIGYGIRIGLSAATISGVSDDNINWLASIIVQVYFGTITSDLKKDAVNYIQSIKPNNLFIKYGV